MSLGPWFRSLVARKRPEPSYPLLPDVAESGESSVSGVYLIGEVGGTPLVKLGLNQGVEVAERLHAELGPAPEDDPDLLDVFIVGAGSSGLGAAARAHELGMRYQVLEANRVAMTIVNMYKGKVLFAEPEAVPNKSSMWFEECTREQLLERWNAQIAETGLKVSEHEKVVDVQRDDGAFRIESEKGNTYRARRVLLAVGKAGNPRKAGVPGEIENGPKVHHSLSDPDLFTDKHIFVYGGGDVAAEATLALCKTNKVTMVTIDKELVFPRKRNVDALMAEKAAGRLDLLLATRLTKIDAESVTYTEPSGQEVTIPNDVVFEMIGAVLPLPFFERVGIKLENTWNWGRWAVLAAVFLSVYTLYALKSFPNHPYSWPFNQLLSPSAFDSVLKPVFEVFFLPFAWLFEPSEYQHILAKRSFQQGYLYSLTYTCLMIGFGYLAFVRWSKVARDNSYQKWRYTTLIVFQVGFFLIVNAIAVKALSVEHAWRAWGLYQPWPLFFNTFFWWKGASAHMMWAFVGAGLVGTFGVIPFMAWKHGKRFCTWICGCGGLAETLGDRWRHMAAKGKRSRAWEFQGAVVLVAAATVTLVCVGWNDTQANNAWGKTYSYLVDFWLVAVIPITLYPFFGGKVWCRYWCPLAAWNQILARWYGRLKITANDKCISCTMCSRYCQVGVDVMAFAKNQTAFDNRTSACIHCGICIDVCPMGVLEFDSSPRGKALPLAN